MAAWGNSSFVAVLNPACPGLALVTPLIWVNHPAPHDNLGRDDMMPCRLKTPTVMTRVTGYTLKREEPGSPCV